ncbi:MAG: hypothetical protein ACLTDS_06600 [Bianqueaceae bacterium]
MQLNLVRKLGMADGVDQNLLSFLRGKPADHQNMEKSILMFLALCSRHKIVIDAIGYDVSFRGVSIYLQLIGYKPRRTMIG